MIHEHHLTVSRTARYYTVGEPGTAARELWVACHGYGQLAAEFVARLAVVASVDRLIAAPEALSRFYLERARGGSHATSPVGASWMTREDRAAEIADQVTYLDGLVDTLKTRAPHVTRVTALGFSQGVATMCRWLMHSRTRVHRVICWGGAMPDDVLSGDLRAFRGVPIALVAGSRDEFATRDRVIHAVTSMRGAGLDVSDVMFEGGHRLDDATLLRIAAAEAGPAEPLGDACVAPTRRSTMS